MQEKLHKISNSMIKAFLECPEAAYHRYFVKDYAYEGSDAQARGTLVDAMVTKALDVTPEATVPQSMLKAAFATKYSDGSDAVSRVCNKNGTFTAAAKTAIMAAQRLLADPVAQRLLDGAEMQKHVEGKFCGVDVQGDIDILTKPQADGKRYLLDLKKVATIDDAWAPVYTEAGIRNVKMPWYDVYDYWMQLRLYKYLLGDPADVRTGLMYVTEQQPANIGVVLVGGDLDVLRAAWEPAVAMIKHIRKDGTLPKLPRSRCGLCAWCRGSSTVTLDLTEQLPTYRYPITG